MRTVTAMGGGSMADRLPGTMAATHPGGDVRGGHQRASRPNTRQAHALDRGEHEALTAALFNATLRINAGAFTTRDD